MPNGGFICETDLHLATQANDEATVKEFLASPAATYRQLNSIEPVNGWTPLFIACVNGSTSIAQVLLTAGADQDVIDFAGWTAKEHAVFRGYLSLAKLFTQQDFNLSGRLRPQENHQIAYRRRCDSSQVFIYLGPSHTRSNEAPVKLDIDDHSRTKSSEDQTKLDVMISSQGTCNEPPLKIQLPIVGNMVNKPLTLSTEDPENIILVFQIYRRSSTQNENVQLLGIATALLKSLQGGLAPNHESITRHYTIPVIQNGKMTCIGSMTFSVLLVTPFHFKASLPKASRGFWRVKGPYPVVGHRGSGANSTARSFLQIGENTYQSFITAINRGASCIEFDVQLTKDYHPIIYHDFLVKETGGDISLHELTFDQFQHFSRSQAPKSDRFGFGEQKYIEGACLDGDPRPKPRRHSLNEYDESRSQDLIDRIKYTDQGLKGKLKGNIRGCAIQEPSTTLEQLLTSLPVDVDFDLEIKYPMLWEAEDRAMEFVAIELNTYIDTILTTIFRHCGQRNITLTSFSPEVCIALACKQRSFPILMINKAGTVPVSDIRAGSLKGVIDFATAWGLDGIVAISDPFLMCPRLLTYAKDMGLVVVSYGKLNNDPECALIQIKAGLDAIITDKAHVISKSLAQMQR
ncbi:MAG: hypothetical protein Q9167_005363 [Letrouitia subvulpina]